MCSLLCPAAERCLMGYCCWSFEWRNVNSLGAHRGRRGQQGATLSSFNLQKDSQGEVLPGLTQSHATTAVCLSSIYKVHEDPEALGPTIAQK